MSDYEAWRISFQSSEQAARSAFNENAKLREKLAEANTRLSGQTCFVPPEFQAELDECKSKLKALDEQEPVGEIIHGQLHWYNGYSPSVPKQDGMLYTRPIPPADVAELQRRISGYESEADRLTVENLARGKRITELESKLARQEQQEEDVRICDRCQRA